MKNLSLFIVAAAIGVVVLFSFYAGLFAGLENFFEDLFFVSRPIHPDIVIVAIDNESISRIGQWPWPREIFAKALSILSEAKPKAVGIDVMFSEQSSLGKKDDKQLESALAQAGYPIVMPVEVFGGITLAPLKGFGEKAALGHVNLILDKDGVARRFPLYVSSQDGNKTEIPAFALTLLEKAGFKREIEAYEVAPRIVYAGSPGAVLRVPFWRLVEKDISLSSFENKIVLIGATAADLHDEQITPFSRGQAMPGVEIQANTLNMFLQGYRLTSLNRLAMSLWIIAATILPALLFLLFRRSLKPIFANLVLGVIYIVAVVILAERGIVPNFIHLNAAWILSTAGLVSFRYFVGERERREMKTLFSRYVSSDVLEEILKDPASVALGGKEVEVTILFSDIRGFTALSEKISPKELVHFLNEYFEVMSNEILKHKGVLDKYIGDAIMAFWGAPVADEEQADNALKAALGMVTALSGLNVKLRSRGKPEINIGIGIYTGPAIVGNVGSKARFDYTAIGDTVNVASRLEGLNKTYGTNIIIGETTKAKLREQYNPRLLDSVEVKGRKQPLEIYTL